MVQVGLVVEEAARVDGTIEDIAEQFGDVAPGGGRAAAPAGVAEERPDEGHPAVRDADDADDRAGPGNGEGRGYGLGGADALERGVGADTAGELEDGLIGFLAACLDDFQATARRR